VVNLEDQLRAVITRQADRYDVPLPDIDGFAAGAMRRRRRQWMVAGLTACAVLAIVAAGLVAGRFWDSGEAQPAGPPTSPAPSTTPSSIDGRFGIVGPPPPGTPYTGPATGELVAAAELYNTGTYVYADGRIINAWKNFESSDRFRGFMVRQLTPSGVEAMRSFLVDGTSRLTTSADRTGGGLIVRDGGRLMHVREFDDCETAGSSRDQSTWVGCPGFTDPDWLPSSAWEDPDYRPFVPHSYQVCVFADPQSSPADVLPAEAIDLVLGPDSPRADSPNAKDGLCTVVADAQARQLTEIMDHAGPGYVREEGDLTLDFSLPSRWTDPDGEVEGWLSILPVLPHGGFYGPGG
jgi:hypothetical protein